LPRRGTDLWQVTQGANQAIMNALLCSTDAEDSVGLLDSYYFNHHMCITQISCKVHLIPRTKSLLPDAERIKMAIVDGKLKALILTNPCNPTGTIIPLATLKEISSACQAHGCTLILDNTYRDFVYEGPKPERLSGRHIINVYSFSKNFGMSGWRMGFLTYHDSWAQSMLKVRS
jgi:aspartate/methionine/tyrosine aminotransferase